MKSFLTPNPQKYYLKLNYIECCERKMYIIVIRAPRTKLAKICTTHRCVTSYESSQCEECAAIFNSIVTDAAWQRIFPALRRSTYICNIFILKLSESLFMWSYERIPCTETRIFVFYTKIYYNQQRYTLLLCYVEYLNCFVHTVIPALSITSHDIGGDFIGVFLHVQFYQDILEHTRWIDVDLGDLARHPFY